MWIEINLNIKVDGMEHLEQDLNFLVNTKQIVLLKCNPGYSVEIMTIPFCQTIHTYNETITNAIYNGLIIALQGQEVTFDTWGYIKPLLNDRREELHKYMLYLKTVDDLTKGE